MSYTRFISFFIPILLSTMYFLMAMPPAYRLIAYSLIVIFFISLLPLFFNVFYEGELLVNSKVFTLLFFLTLLLFKDIVFFISGDSALISIVMSGFEVLFFFCLIILYHSNDLEKIMHRTFKLAAILSAISLAIYFIADFKLSSYNFYAALMCPLFVYYACNRKLGILQMFFMLFILLLSILFDARAATIIIALSVMVYFTRDYLNNLNIIFLILFIVFLFLQYYIQSENSLLYNELLTYRPTIWNFYFEESMKEFWYGHGAISSDATIGAAEAYGENVGRGVAESYGTQSMYIAYFYSSGIIGVFFVIVLILLAFSKNNKFTLGLFIYSLIGLIETIKVGSISVYGLPLTLFIFLTLSEFNEDLSTTEFSDVEVK